MSLIHTEEYRYCPHERIANRYRIAPYRTQDVSGRKEGIGEFLFFLTVSALRALLTFVLSLINSVVVGGDEGASFALPGCAPPHN